jgi:hypothetical protein
MRVQAVVNATAVAIRESLIERFILDNTFRKKKETEYETKNEIQWSHKKIREHNSP